MATNYFNEPTMGDPVSALQTLSRRPDLGFDASTIATAEELLATISKQHHTPYSTSLVQSIRAIYKPCALRLLFLAGNEERDPRLGCADLQALNSCILSLRVLRNLCAQGRDAQACVAEHSAVHRSLALLLPKLDRLRDGTDYWSDQVGALARAGMQLLTNLITDNVVLCNVVHRTIGNRQLYSTAMFAKSRHDAPLIRLLSALIYNLAKHGGENSVMALLTSSSPTSASGGNNNENSNNNNSKIRSISGKSPVSLLLQAVIGETEPDSRDEDAFDLICWFHGEIIQHGPVALHALLACVGPTSSASAPPNSSASDVDADLEFTTDDADEIFDDGLAVTPEQIIVVKTLHSIMGLAGDSKLVQSPEGVEEYNAEDEQALLQMRQVELVGGAASADALVVAMLVWMHRWLGARDLVRDAVGQRAEVAAVLRCLVSEATATLSHVIGHLSSVAVREQDNFVQVEQQGGEEQQQQQQQEQQQEQEGEGGEQGVEQQQQQQTQPQQQQQKDEVQQQEQGEDISTSTSIRKLALGSMLERLDELNRSSVEKIQASEEAGVNSTPVSWADDEQSAAATLAKNKAAKALAAAAVGQVDAAHGERSGLVRVIANLVFRNKAMQDFVREYKVRGSRYGGVQTVLSSCNYDDHSPLLREWGLLAVRNLCEENYLNQKLIASLRMDGVVQHPIIHKAGYKVEMPDEGSKPVVSRRQSGEEVMVEEEEEANEVGESLLSDLEAASWH